MNVRDFSALSQELARSALNAELEYLRWNGESILDGGCEALLTTSAARSASAFFGTSGRTKVYIERPISTIFAEMGLKTQLTGRVDCAIYEGERPRAIIECKRFLPRTGSDIERCATMLRGNTTLQSALIVGLRLESGHSRTPRLEALEKLTKKLNCNYPDFRFELFHCSQEHDPPMLYEMRGKERVRTHTFAACLKMVVR